MSTEPDPREEEALQFLMECMFKRSRSGLPKGTISAQQEEPPQPEHESPFEKISKLSAQGLSARQIGKEIGVSRKEVKKHLERIK